MSIVVPKDLESSTGIPSCDVQFAQRVKSAFSDDTWVWYNPRGFSKRPPFVLISPDVGVAGLAVFGWTQAEIQQVSPSGVRLSDGSKCDPLGELGQELEVLSAKVRDLSPSPPLNGLLVFPNLTDDEFLAAGLNRTVPPDVVVTSSALSNGFASRFTLNTRISRDVIDEVRQRLYPDTAFTRPQLVSNEGKAERLEKRIQLDLEQQSSARYIGSEATVVVGVAGSGKSLVAASRARYLMQEHPEWKIKLLCYNQTLVHYLQSLVAPPSPTFTTEEVLHQLAAGQITADEAGRLINARNNQLSVDTFHKWAGARGLRLPFREDRQDEAEQRVQDAISRGVYRHEYDAIIIDEGQDFRPSWLSLVQQAVRPDRGGLLVVLDAAQCIYQEPSHLAFLSENVREIRLTKNYRNTEQVGRLAYHICPEVAPTTDGETWNTLEPDFVLQGEPVQLVWAESWDEQARFVAAEIQRLVASGKVEYRDVGVLFPQKRGTTRLAEALSEAEIPFYMRKRDNRRDFSMEDNTVKLLTIHSAKGLEFSVVFLFGVEAIPSGQDSRDRVAFVGMTRATDVLYLTYTRMNPLLDRAAAAPEWCQFRSWPDDF